MINFLFTSQKNIKSAVVQKIYKYANQIFPKPDIFQRQSYSYAWYEGKVNTYTSGL